MSIIKINHTSLNTWIQDMINNIKVYGVQAKGEGFVFGSLDKAENLKLDYDVTILPPKKYFLSNKEAIVEFSNEGEYQSLIDNEEFVLFGVHPYDMVAISQMDKVFSSDNYDIHYMTRRNNATIVVCDIQRVSSNVFAGYLNTATVQGGYDVLLTLVDDEYIVEAKTKKGEKLLENISTDLEIDKEDIAKREQVWRNNTKLLRKHRIKFNPKDIGKILEKSYDNPLWEEKAKYCFSCGTCNLVCPTCYCFNLQDDVNWDLNSGKRTRLWDGCLLKDFAGVAGGHNFRALGAERFRHRYYRKGKYLTEKLGGLACVGCGRCISACLSRIANPVEVFNRLSMNRKSIYLPEPATLVGKKSMTELETFYEFRLDSGISLGHEPGQFLEVSVPGIGEAPISISSSPTKQDTFQLVVRSVGNVTKALSNLGLGDKVGIRGPFGTNFPVDNVMKGKDILLICGGIGLVPVRSVINYILENRSEYGQLNILYGKKNPSERLFVEEIEEWKKSPDVLVLETVDSGTKEWKGHIGIITMLLPLVKLNPANTVAIICGPPIMYKSVLAELDKMGVSDEAIYVSLERRMKCGVGKCGHCQMNEIYVCQEGPVFRYSDIKAVMEAI